MQEPTVGETFAVLSDLHNMALRGHRLSQFAPPAPTFLT